MTEETWSNDPRFNKSANAAKFAGLRETVEKTAGFVAGMEPVPGQVNAGTETAAPSSNGETSYSQQQVDDLVAGARAEGVVEGQAQAEQQFAQTHAERLDAVQSEFADFMASLQSDFAQRQPLFQPLRDLALALAEHLARVELSLSDAAIDAVINTAINGLDPSDLGQIEIHVSEAWAERLKGQPLQGVADGYPVITAEGLSDGDVRLVVNNAQVEDLIAERIEQLAQQMNNADFTDVAEGAAVAEMENESAEPTAAAALEDSVDGNRASLDADDAVFEELPAVDSESDEE
jgi:flagellar biosynthesis/type III secretory pathway protein FliH